MKNGIGRRKFERVNGNRGPKVRYPLRIRDNGSDSPRPLSLDQIGMSLIGSGKLVGP